MVLQKIASWKRQGSDLTQPGMSYVLLILRSIFQSDLGTKCGREATAFADGTKLGGTSAREGKSALQEELDNRECWHIGDGMTCNSGMCKVVHLGIANKNLCCKLGAHRLEMTEEEKNLGVFVDLKMTKNSQYEAALMKSVYQLRSFQERSKRLILLPKALLQPPLDLCSSGHF